MKYNIERFIKAQKDTFDYVIKELKTERKESHWIWYIFPQIKGLGESPNAVYYSIENIEEAKQYCLNEILYNRYRLCCTILLNAKAKDINLIMGYIGAMKLKSSLTLFYYADKDNNELYKQLIDKYFYSKFDELTINKLKSII